MNMQEKPHLAFWSISAVALVWNLMGVWAYIQHVTMSPEAKAALPAAEQAFYLNTPAWVTGAFAVAVFAGALGCVALLLRRRAAIWLFAVSLIGVLAQHLHSFFLSNALEVYGAAAAAWPIIVLVIALVLVWFAKYSADKGWLR